MHKGHGSRSVCVSVCVSVTMLVPTYLIYTLKVRCHYRLSDFNVYNV